MNAQMPKLKSRDIFLIVVALCLISLVLWYFSRFQSRQQQIQEIQSNLELTTGQLDILNSQQTQLPKLRADVKALEIKQDIFVKALPSTIQVGQVVQDLRDSVRASQSQLDSIDQRESSTIDNTLPAGVKAVQLSVNVKGQFLPLLRTVRSFETLGRFSKITNIKMVVPAPNDKDPMLNGTIDLLVYTFDPASAQPAPATPADGTAPAAPSTGGNS